MSTDNTAPATKQDIAIIMDMMAKVLEEVHSIKTELRAEMKQDFASKQDLALAVELIRGDLVGANSDKLAQHDNVLGDHGTRITKIEKKLSLAA